MSEYRKASFVEQSKAGTYTASIDVLRQYDYKDEQWHLSAIEFHHKNKDEVIKLRDAIFDLLTSKIKVISK